MRHAVILAGGSGTRLWPASRRAHPKQLLSLTADGEPMVAAAVRLGRELAQDRVLVVTAESQEMATHRAMPSVAILTEPIGRNTAAAIGLAAATIALTDPDAVLVVLPADQHIRDKAGMVRMLEYACLAAETNDVIATIGIVPTRAETGFGYLEIDGVIVPGMPARVIRFVEKPDLPTAEDFVASGRYLWNAGIFCMTARRLLAELDAHLPETGCAVRQIARHPATSGTTGPLASSLYAALPSISIDHGVMEKVTGVVTVPAAVGWDDVGSWAALPAVRGVDDANNTIVGQALVLEGTGNVVVSDDDATIIAMVGISDMVVIKSGDAILVVRKDQAQDVRKVIDALTARGLLTYL